ncbi:uncharacterized protein LOC122088758 [Macadamia integrifolia]|uniref:uncharacterized protein LOC122088758 n=1 Tax=Macadamia integrifolia TaxID=60698 RepID=UPI001C4FC94C|nr:uncharacterized protein LOC122088758 [Macadamia integrifolia]
MARYRLLKIFIPNIDVYGFLVFFQPSSRTKSSKPFCNLDGERRVHNGEFPLPVSRKMSSFTTAQGVLEVAKFALYVTVPAALMYTFAHNSDNLKKVMGNRSYVVYPPEGPRPQSPEELREMAREIARKNNMR